MTILRHFMLHDLLADILIISHLTTSYCVLLAVDLDVIVYFWPIQYNERINYVELNNTPAPPLDRTRTALRLRDTYKLFLVRDSANLCLCRSSKLPAEPDGAN